MLLPKHAIFDRGQSLLRNVFLRSGLWLRLTTIRELLSTSLALLAGYTLNTATYSAGSIIAAKSFPNALNPPQWLSGLPFLPRSLGLSVTTSVASHQANYKDTRKYLLEEFTFLLSMLRSLSNFGGSLATSAVRLVLQHSLFCRKILKKEMSREFGRLFR